MTKKIKALEFVGLPIPVEDVMAITALSIQRQQVEKQWVRIINAINAIAARIAKEAGWGDVPGSELRIEARGENELVLMRVAKPAGPEEKQ